MINRNKIPELITLIGKVKKKRVIIIIANNIPKECSYIQIFNYSYSVKNNFFEIVTTF